MLWNHFIQISDIGLSTVPVFSGDLRRNGVITAVAILRGKKERGVKGREKDPINLCTYTQTHTDTHSIHT